MRALLLLLALVTGFPPGGSVPAARAQAAAGAFSPDELRVAVLSKLPPYIVWPEASADAPIVIGVLGANPLGALLEELLRGVRVRQRPVEVRHLTNAVPAELPDLLFVPAGYAAELAALPAERLRGVVTVGEDPDFLKRGGIINLRPDADGGKISLQVSLKNARAQGIKISTPLLRIAEVVDR
jgi:hypothetical protein